MKAEDENAVKDEADRCSMRGFLLSARARTPKQFAEAAHLWEKALKLYRSAGDEKMAAQIEERLHDVSRRLSRPVVGEEGLASRGWKPALGAKERFQDWWVFFKIGCFGVGGPMAVWALLQEELVVRKAVMSNQEFLEGAVLGDILPGPVTMDIVTYAGFKLRGWLGAFYSTVIFILPSFLLMLVVAQLYGKYSSVPLITEVFQCLGAAVTAVVIAVGLKLGKEEIKDPCTAGIFLWAFVSSMIFKIDIMFVVGLAGGAGLLLELVRRE